MRVVKMKTMITAGALVACSGEASAATILLQGTITPQTPWQSIEGPSPYTNTIHPLVGRFRVSFSRPVTGSFLGIGQVYLDYYDADGNLYNDDNGDVAAGGMFTHQKSKVFTVTTKGEFRDALPGGWAEGGAWPFFYEFDLSGLERSIDFTVTSLKAGRAGAVPEPATWALMILGLGATGTALRRRKRTSSASVMALSRAATPA